MATKKSFTWNSGASGSTGATGASSVEHAPYAHKVVQAWLNTGGTGATIDVYGSIDGGTHKFKLDTLTLTGSGGVDTSELVNAYDFVSLNLTAVTGTVTAMVRSVD